MTQFGPNSTSNDTDMPNRGQLDDKECSTKGLFLSGFCFGAESTNGTANFIVWATRIAVTFQPQLQVRLSVHQGTP